MTQPDRRNERGSLALKALGIISLVLFFLAMLAVIVLFTFSVKVDGRSMEPTLQDGDRLSTNILGRDHVERFDLVKTRAGENGIDVVKRVVGMPGDRISIDGGEQPVVLIQPAGETDTYRVDNPAWPSRIEGRTQSCCTKAGKAVPSGGARWTTIPEDTFWVLGDNWGGSDDSRVFGYVTQAHIAATISFRLQPFGSAGSIESDVKLVPAN